MQYESEIYQVPVGVVPRPEQPQFVSTMKSQKRSEHNHYFKNVEHLKTIDVYRVLQLFNVTDPCIQHAIKKLLVAGGRGAGKDLDKDVKEAIDSLKRHQEIKDEDYTHV